MKHFGYKIKHHRERKKRVDISVAFLLIETRKLLFAQHTRVTLRGDMLIGLLVLRITTTASSTTSTTTSAAAARAVPRASSIPRPSTAIWLPRTAARTIPTAPAIQCARWSAWLSGTAWCCARLRHELWWASPTWIWSSWAVLWSSRSRLRTSWAISTPATYWPTGHEPAASTTADT